MKYKYDEARAGTPRNALPVGSSLSRGPATVLIVEDEALVRISGAGMFTDAGFRVIEAVDSNEALECLVMDSEVHVLFTDVNLPGISDGLALARQVRSRWPHIGIIVVSGHSIPRPYELPAGCGFHRKPYDAGSVVRHARELMAA